MSTFVYTLERGRVDAVCIDEPVHAVLFAEDVERRGGLASVVRNGRVIRWPGLIVTPGTAGRSA